MKTQHLKVQGPGWLTWLGLGVVGGSAAVLTFTTLRDLAIACGITGTFLVVPLAWLVPVTVDAAGAVAVRLWLTRAGGADAQRLAQWLSWTCIALSVAGNAVQHGMSAFGATPGWYVVVLVSAVPPAMLGAVVHLSVLVTRADETGDRVPELAVAPQAHTPHPEPVVAAPKQVPNPEPVVAEPQTPRPRPVAAAETRRDRVSIAVNPEGDEDKLAALRQWREDNPGTPLSQRRVINICKTNNARAKTLLTALENE